MLKNCFFVSVPGNSIATLKKKKSHMQHVSINSLSLNSNGMEEIYTPLSRQWKFSLPRSQLLMLWIKFHKRSSESNIVALIESCLVLSYLL